MNASAGYSSFIGAAHEYFDDTTSASAAVFAP
jgi:hypothetical protein